jgi:uncharacterized phage protein (TIGR01671 family)
MKQREIKFRVWDGKDMREPPPLNEWDMEDGEFWVEYCDNPIMQFTGLKDKNGTDIYEGDVVGYNAYHGTHPEGEQPWTGGVMVIEWNNESASFKTPFSETRGLPVSVPHESIEVIGNIYENPELLPTNTTEGR